MIIFQTEYEDYIKKNIFPRIRKSKYTNEYFVDQNLDCNLNFVSWASLSKTFGKYTDKSRYHHKYLNEIYLKWADVDVFKIAYKNIITDNLNYDPKNLKLNTDVTCISNMYGKENIGVNPEYAKKNVTKVAFLNTTKINTPTSLSIIDNNKIFELYKTLRHNKSSVQPLLNNILIPIDDKCIIDINVDKAYISNEIYACANAKINIKTPKKRKINCTNK